MKSVKVGLRLTLPNDLRRWRFWRRFFTHFFAALGAVSAVAGIASLFFGTLPTGFDWVLWVSIMLAVGYGGYVAWPRPISVVFASPSTRIRVVRGDLFAQPTHLVIGACDTFDTAAPYIAPKSVQAIYSETVYQGDLRALDAVLNRQLSTLVPVGTISKAGKTNRYALGTVLPLAAQGRRHFWVAYTSMDANNKAHGTPDGLWKSLINLWDVSRVYSNGDAISMPVLGGGQSGLSPVLPAEDAIRFIALSFIIASRLNRVCDELRIVALPELYDRLNHLELQAFLSGLAVRDW